MPEPQSREEREGHRLSRAGLAHAFAAIALDRENQRRAAALAAAGREADR
jgi:hypothetical protein